MDSTSAGSMTAPEGLEGEQRMMAFVRSVIAASIMLAVTRKFSRSSVSMKRTVPPAYWMMSL